jgi:hypothetical protein
MNKNRNKNILLKLSAMFIYIAGLCFTNSCNIKKGNTAKVINSEKPKIVNIINFKRFLEPRDSKIT